MKAFLCKHFNLLSQLFRFPIHSTISIRFLNRGLLFTAVYFFFIFLLFYFLRNENIGRSLYYLTLFLLLRYWFCFYIKLYTRCDQTITVIFKFRKLRIFDFRIFLFFFRRWCLSLLDVKPGFKPHARYRNKMRKEFLR